MAVSKNLGLRCSSPYKKDHNTLLSILGLFIYGNLHKEGFIRAARKGGLSRTVPIPEFLRKP